jgi:hypothetical protein
MEIADPPPNTTNYYSDCCDQAGYFLLTWTPRILIAGIIGYYSLGIAYDWGIMAAIDRVAISILRDTVGYVGIGVFMPTIQWYAAWSVQVISAACAGLLYDLVERLTVFILSRLHNRCCASETSSPPDAAQMV